MTLISDFQLPVRHRLFSRQQAAAYLGISLTGLKSLLVSGAFPMLKIGSRTLIDRDDIDDFIDGQKNGGKGKEAPIEHP